MTSELHHALFVMVLAGGSPPTLDLDLVMTSSQDLRMNKFLSSCIFLHAYFLKFKFIFMKIKPPLDNEKCMVYLLTTNSYAIAIQTKSSSSMGSIHWGACGFTHLPTPVPTISPRNPPCSYPSHPKHPNQTSDYVM